MRKRFTAQQVEMLNSAFEVEESPDRENQQAMAASLGVQVKRIQVNKQHFDSFSPVKINYYRSSNGVVLM